MLLQCWPNQLSVSALQIRMEYWQHPTAVREQHPPLPAGDGLVDIEPTLLALSEAFGLDPDELLQEAEQVIAELEAGGEYQRPLDKQRY